MRFIVILLVLLFSNTISSAQVAFHARNNDVLYAQKNIEKKLSHYLLQDKADSALGLIDSIFLFKNTAVKLQIIKAAKLISTHYDTTIDTHLMVLYSKNANEIRFGFYPDYEFRLSFIWNNKNSKIIKIIILDKKQLKEEKKK